MENASTGRQGTQDSGDSGLGCVVVPNMEGVDLTQPLGNNQPKKVYSVDGKLEEKKARWIALKNSIAPAEDSTPMEPTIQTIADCQKFMSENGNINQYDKYGFTVVQYAARTGSVTLLRWALSNDGDETKTTAHENDTLLHLAVKSGNVNLTQYLVDIRGFDVNATNKEGMTPLMIAAKLGRIFDVAVLLDTKGINVQLVDNNGRNALHWAAERGDEVNIERIGTFASQLALQREKNGMTPMHLASFNSQVGLQKLLELDPSPLIMRDQRGKAPLDYVIEHNPNDTKLISNIRYQTVLLQFLSYGGNILKKNLLSVVSIITILTFQLMLMYLPFWFVAIVFVGGGRYLWLYWETDIKFRYKFYAAFWIVGNVLVFITEWTVVVPEMMGDHPTLLVTLVVAYPALIWAFYRLSKKQPMVIHEKDIPTLYQHCHTFTEDNFSFQQSGKYCPTCLVNRPPLSKHCIICNKCLYHFDHHCYWVDACIGEGNHRTFFFTLWFFVIGIWITIRFFYLYLTTRPEVAVADGMIETVMAMYTYYPYCWSLFTSMIVFIPFMTLTACQQLYCASLGITLAELATREYKKRADVVSLNPFRASSALNLYDFVRGIPKIPHFKSDIESNE